MVNKSAFACPACISWPEKNCAKPFDRIAVHPQLLLLSFPFLLFLPSLILMFFHQSGYYLAQSDLILPCSWPPFVMYAATMATCATHLHHKEVLNRLHATAAFGAAGWVLFSHACARLFVHTLGNMLMLSMSCCIQETDLLQSRALY